MSNELFTFRDSKELRSPKKTFWNGLVGIIALAVVGGAAFSAKKAIENIGLSTPQIAATPSVEKQCSPSEPYARIQLPGGDAEVQVVESVGSAKKPEKLGWLCLQLVSTDDSVGAYRNMSLMVSTLNRPNEADSDSGEFGYSTKWIVVNPNNPVEVVAEVDEPQQRNADPASVTIGFNLMYPVTNQSNELIYGVPEISDFYTDPAAVTA